MTSYHLKFDNPVTGLKDGRGWQEGDAILLKELEAGIPPYPGMENDAHSDPSSPELQQQHIAGLEEELEAARKVGFQEGMLKGMEAGRQELSGELAALQSTIKGLQDQWPEMLDKLELPLLEIAKKLATIVLSVSSFDSELFQQAMQEKLREMLSRLTSQKKIVVELHPEVIGIVDKNALLPDAHDNTGPELLLLPNRHLKMGECQLKSEDYLIDASYDGQIDFLVGQLTGEVTA